MNELSAQSGDVMASKVVLSVPGPNVEWFICRLRDVQDQIQVIAARLLTLDRKFAVAVGPRFRVTVPTKTDSQLVRTRRRWVIPLRPVGSGTNQIRHPD